MMVKFKGSLSGSENTALKLMVDLFVPEVRVTLLMVPLWVGETSVRFVMGPKSVTFMVTVPLLVELYG